VPIGRMPVVFAAQPARFEFLNFWAN
jgi:hypothetical protein